MTAIGRRAFLQLLGFGTVAAAAAATAAWDVERLLWVPAEKTIMLPAETIMVAKPMLTWRAAQDLMIRAQLFGHCSRADAERMIAADFTIMGS